jgi:hypothetical protein
MRCAILSILLIIAGCKGDSGMVEKVKLPSMNDIPKSTWQSLYQKKIYFGHQSVGDNIIDGIKIVMKSNNNIKLNIQKLNEVEESNIPVFAHSYIGANEDIDSKLNGFSQNIKNELKGNVDIAFLKLCFWDVRSKTDINWVFNNYKKTMDKLKAEFPNITFLYFTVPLMTHSNSVLSAFKRIIKPDNSDLDNIQRNELNRLIVLEYNGKEPLFDVARVESTRPDGSRAVFVSGGKEYYYLPVEYTNDGGHLNAYARKYVAEQLLITLARLAN